MKFKFLGDTKNMKVFGYDFSDGATPDVTDEKVIAKLSGNAEFEAVEKVDQGKPADTKKAGKEDKKPAVDPVATPPVVDAVVAGGEGDTGSLPGMGA